MNTLKNWRRAHPDLWEFILFNLLSNCATAVNFLVMWLCTGVIFAPLSRQPFSFFLFNYTHVERDLGLCGFLSFLTATAVAQGVNFFVQRDLVFHSDARFGRAMPRYLVLAVGLVLVSAALPGYSQGLLIRMGVPGVLAPTLANGVNILVQVAVSYPAMKFWIMPAGK